MFSFPTVGFDAKVGKYSDMFEISTIVLPDGKDPSDLTVEELQIETRKML